MKYILFVQKGEEGKTRAGRSRKEIKTEWVKNENELCKKKQKYRTHGGFRTNVLLVYPYGKLIHKCMSVVNELVIS